MKTNRNKKEEILTTLRSRYFIDPQGKNQEQLVDLVQVALSSLVKHQGSSPIFPINIGIPSYSSVVKSSIIPEKFQPNAKGYLKNLHTQVQGSVKAGHPYMVKNIIPTASLPSLATYLAVSLYMPNGVSGEDAAQVLNAEISCVAAISRLAGLDAKRSAGVFTFGGTGTNLYGIKMGLVKTHPNHMKDGDTKGAVVIESVPAHYCHKTAAIWLGIGENNSIRVSSNTDQTTNLEELARICRDELSKGKKIACINALGGTTSNMGIDDIKKIYDMRESLVREFSLSYSPHIHVDSVLGWVFLVFCKYDFSKNSLGFTPDAIKQLKKIVKRVKTFKYADSFGVDFHKTGYVAYTSSMIIVKDKKDLMSLQRDVSIMTPLFHDDEAYNPGKFTLETSRSAASMLATWTALQTFGIEGYQALLGNAIEMGLVIRKEVENAAKEGLFVANQEQYGPDIFVRCYAPGIDSNKEYWSELSDDLQLAKNTAYINTFSKWLFKTMPTSEKGFALSKSSAAIYTLKGSPMVALRIYPLSPYITQKTAKELVKRLIKAKRQFDLKTS